MKIAIASVILAAAATPALADAPLLDEPETRVELFSKGTEDWYQAKLKVDVWNLKRESDGAKLQWKSGGKVVATIICKSAFDQDSMSTTFTCDSEGTKLKATGVIEAKLVFVDGADDTETPLRTFKFDVKRYAAKAGGGDYQIFGDDLLGAAFAVHDKRYGHVNFHFWTTATLQGTPKLRCTVGGKQLDDSRTRFESNTSMTIDNIPKSGARFGAKWTHQYMPTDDLTFGTRAAYKGTGTVEKMRFLGDNPGAWSCVVRLEGTVVRQFDFEVGADGMIVGDAWNTGKNAVRLRSNTVAVAMTVPKGIDPRVRPAAMKGSFNFGLPWPDSPKVKTLQAAFPPQVGNDK